MRTVKLLISGRVQGVFFRASTHKQALSLGVNGTVRNLDDGRVEVVAQGLVEPLEALIAWCHQGPSKAQVEHVEILEQASDMSFFSFKIID